jgi:hypothetical protein
LSDDIHNSVHKITMAVLRAALVESVHEKKNSNATQATQIAEHPLDLTLRPMSVACIQTPPPLTADGFR